MNEAGGGPRLRAARDEDGPAVAALVWTVLTELGLSPSRERLEADLRALERSRQGGAFWVLEEMSGAISGSAGLRRVDAVTVELQRMYLRPERRGQGWGGRMLELALGEARRLGYRRVVLDTSTRMRSAIGLYRRRGFSPLEPESGSRDGCDLAFELRLDEPRRPDSVAVPD